MICCYTHDYLDPVDITRVANELADAVKGVFSGSARYKPDIYTFLDIYKGNPYGIAPTIRSCNI